MTTRDTTTAMTHPIIAPVLFLNAVLPELELVGKTDVGVEKGALALNNE